MKDQTRLKKLGNTIKTNRKKKALTLSKLGSELGYSATLVHHWESGRKEPTGLALLDLIRVLSLTMKDLKNI